MNMFSIVVPIYRNESSLRELLDALQDVTERFRSEHSTDVEVVCVVDGSPDESYRLLEALLPETSFRSQLIAHSRNFGSFAAIRTGLIAARGEILGVIAADLQEPPDLMLDFYCKISEGADVVVGSRTSRDDPYLTKFLSGLFWRFYKRFVIPDVPENGVDVFGVNRRFRESLLEMKEANSSLIGQLFWLGYKRETVYYKRLKRPYGNSAWTFRKKIDYLLDSVFSFTDLPIRILFTVGVIGILFSIIFGFIIFAGRSLGYIDVPGYAATVLTIIFFGGLNSLGLGIIGFYCWRIYENTKKRPLAVVMDHKEIIGKYSR